MMLLSVAVMTAAMLAMLASDPRPDRRRRGLAADPARCVMGFAVGGEYTGVVAYLLEGARPDRRGLITSLAAAASEVGALLAVGVSALTVSGDERCRSRAWGWRIPFLFGAALAATVWVARHAMEESPDFEHQRAAGRVPANPILHSVSNHRIGIFRAFTISALGSITYYVGITYVPAFLTSVGTMAEGDSLWLSTVAAVIVILVTPAIGASSDRFGRKPVLLTLCALSAILPISMFTLMAGILDRGIAGRGRARRRCGRGKRGRCGRHRRAISRGRALERPGVGGDHGDRDLRWADTLSRAIADCGDRFRGDARRDDRRRRRVRPSGAAENG